MGATSTGSHARLLILGEVTARAGSLAPPLASWAAAVLVCFRVHLLTLELASLTDYRALRRVLLAVPVLLMLNRASPRALVMAVSRWQLTGALRVGKRRLTAVKGAGASLPTVLMATPTH